MKLAIERICVPTDFSPAADHAVHYAAALAHAHGAALHLLHVIEHAGPLVHHPDFTGDGEVARNYFNQLEQAAARADEADSAASVDAAEAGDAEETGKDEASFLVPDLIKSIKSGADDKIDSVGNPWWASLEVHRDVRYGNAVKEINHYVERLDIDLVVIGTHGHSKIAKMLLGSVTERIVRICSCPVTVIRHPEHSYKVYPDE